MFENRRLVRAQYAQPVVQIRRVQLERMRGEPKLLPQKAGRQLGHDLFAGISCVAKSAETVVSVQTMGRLGGMGVMPMSA